MSWNNKANAPNWRGIINTIPNNLIVSSIQTNYISTSIINASTINANTISSAKINVSTINANTISSAIINASTINANTISSAIINVSTLNVNNISTALINVSTLNTNNISSAVINVSSIFTNYLSSATANIPNIITSSINGTDIINFDARRWSFYPAVTQVEMAYNNLHNAGSINMAGNFTMAGTGNLFSPYWYNARIDANIYTGDINNQYNPTIEQYTNSYTLQNVNVDLNNAIMSYPNASLKLYPAAIFPVGNAVLNSKNFYSINPISGYLSGNFRGYAGMVVDGGDGTSCYVKLNADILTSFIPNTAPLTYQNGDSYLTAITVLGVSRIATTYGDIQNLGTYRCQNVAGYFGTSANFSPVCSIKQEAVAGGAGGGTCLNIVDAGLFGARNDMIAKNNYNGGGGGLTAVVMEIGSRGNLYIYSGATLYIGQNPGTYFNDGQGAVYIENVDGLRVRNIYGIGGGNININNNVDATGYIRSPDLYTATIHNNMAGTTPINVVNSLNLCNNDINSVNNISTNTIVLYSKGLDSNASITFASSNGDLQTTFQQSQDDNNNTFTLASVSSIFVASLEGVLLLSGKDVVGIGSTESVVGITGNLGVTIESTTGEVALTGNTRTLITGSTSFIDLSSNPLDVNDSIIDIVASTINLKGDIYGNNNIFYNLNTISTTNVYTDNIYTYNIGNPNPYDPTPIKVNNDFNMQESDIINVDLISTASLFTSSIKANNIININLISTASLFTSSFIANNVSTVSLFTSSIRANNVSSIFNQVSSMRVQNTMTASTIATDTLTAPSGGMYLSGNLYPKSAGSQLGFTGSAGTNSGGFFSQINVRSTITQVIQPDIAPGIYSNVIRINGNISTQSLFVSSINSKQYPFTSTLGVFGAGRTQSTFTVAGTSATTPQILLQNIPFPAVGNYLITQKNTITKSAGGAGAEPYGTLCLSRGLFPSTFSTEDGFNSVPFINTTNVSTFNTFTTSITITNPLSNTRNLTYYDQSGHNYDLNIAIGDLRIRYIPYQGLAGEVGL